MKAQFSHFLDGDVNKNTHSLALLWGLDDIWYKS